MNIVVGGGTGIIGREICKFLKTCGHAVRIVSRSPKTAGDLSWADIKSSGLPEKTDVVLNFSGRNIGEVNPLFISPRFYDAYIKEVYSSRIETTKLLAEASRSVPLKTFISASAIGFYRPDLDAKFYESEQFVDCGMISRLVRDWEAAAKIPDRDDIRQFQLRLGVVLARNSHFIVAQYPALRLGLGGAIGSGRQWISWIHLDDVVGITNFLLSPGCPVPSGPVNATSPNACRQAALSKALSEAMGAPSWPFQPPPLPRLMARILMGSDRATLLLDGQRVIPQKLLDAGYRFEHSRVDDALCSIFGRHPSDVPTD